MKKKLPADIKKHLEMIQELPSFARHRSEKEKEGEKTNEFRKDESCVALVDHMFYAYFLLCCNQLWIAGIV